MGAALPTARGPAIGPRARGGGPAASAGRVAIAAAIAVAIACGTPADESDRDARASTATSHAIDEAIRLPLETAIVTLDPATASDAVSRRITGQLFETLVDWDPHASPPRPLPGLLADLPRLDDEGRTLTLVLRSEGDAHRFAPDPCLDGDDAARVGRAVVAADVAASLLRHADPGLAGAYGLLAGRITGLDAWRESPPNARPRLPEGLTIVDPSTLVIRLTRPQPEFTAILGSPQLAIVPPECVRHYDGRDDAHPPWSRHPVGSGPYVLDAAGTALPRAAALRKSPTFTPRPYPARPGEASPCPTAPAIDRVILEHFESPDTALRLFQRGLLAALAPGQGAFDEVIAAGAVREGHVPKDTSIDRSSVLATTVLAFRMDDPILGQHATPSDDDRHRALRQAIAAAFDGARYHSIIRSGAWASPASQLTPPALLRVDGPPLHLHAPASRDEAAARARLQIAALGDAPLVLRYATTTGPAAQQEAAILRESLRPLGIEVEVIADDAYLFKILAGQLRAQLYSLRFDADYPDAESFLAPFVCGDPNNYTAYCSRRFDAAYARFAALPPGPARDRAAVELERILGEDVPIRPIDHPELWTLVRGDLVGFVRDPLRGLRVDLLCRRESISRPPR